MTTRKIIPLLLAAALTLALTGCAESNEPKDTPVRVGTKGTIQTSFSGIPFTLEEAVEDSDLIAEVTIIEWLGEYNVDEHSDVKATYFNAIVNNTIKGEVHETITLKQDGWSEWTYENYPLFKNGDRLFLFLLKLSNTEYDNAYWVGTSHMSVYELQELDGETYIISRGGLLTVSDEININDSIQIFDDKIIDKLIEQINQSDPIRAEVERTYENVLKYDDIINLFKILT